MVLELDGPIYGPFTPLNSEMDLNRISELLPGVALHNSVGTETQLKIPFQ